MAGSRISVEDLIEKYTLSQDLLDQEVSEEHLKEVSRIIEDPEIVGPELGLTPPEMTTVSSNARSKELQRAAMLTKWKQTHAFKATYKKLIKALLKCHRADHAQRVCELLKSK